MSPKVFSWILVEDRYSFTVLCSHSNPAGVRILWLIINQEESMPLQNDDTVID
ncbi:MAG: hypothetical protein ACI9Z9_002420, partial [Litorivivens sp.]